MFRMPRSILGISLALLATSANATEIAYAASNTSGTTWEYNFSVTNDTLSVPISDFDVYFDALTISNITPVSQPADFAGPSAAEPSVPPSPLPGFVNYLASDAGIAVGATAGGFIVDVTFSGQGTPGAPTFDVLDASFNTLDAGSTKPSGGVAVPEPSTLGLLGAGLILTYLRRRRAQRA